MIINDEIKKFKAEKHKSGLYMVYVKDVINDTNCTGIYFIHEDYILKPKMKKITNPKKKVKISLWTTLYLIGRI